MNAPLTKEPRKGSMHEPNALINQVELSVGVLHNVDSTAAQLEEAIRETTPYRLRTSHTLEWCHIRGVEQQVQDSIRARVKKQLGRLEIQYEPEFSPMEFVHPNDREKCVVQYYLPYNGGGNYKTDTGEIGILAEIIGRAERAYPLLDFNYPSVAKHEEIHRLHWSRNADFLNLAAPASANESSQVVSDFDSQADVSESDPQMKTDSITVPSGALAPLGFVWFDEAWAYCNDTAIDGATTLEWQIQKMCLPETYCTFTPPTRDYAETIVVLTAAAMEIGITDVEFFDHLIHNIYQGENSEAIASSDSAFNKRAYEEQAVIACQNFVLQKFQEKGILGPNDQDPLLHLNEYAKRFFLRAVLKREVVGLVVQESLTENLKRIVLPTGVIVHEHVDDPSPDRILMPLGGEVGGALAMNQLYLLIKPNVDYFGVAPEFRNSVPYRLHLVDYDVAVADIRDVSIYLPEGRPELVNFKRIAKRFVDELPEADLHKLLTVGTNSGTFFVPEISGILHEIGNAIITELALRGHITEREAEIIIAMRGLEQTALRHLNYVSSSREHLLTAAEFHRVADVDGNHENRIFVERNDLVNIYGFDLGNEYGFNPEETAIFTFTVPTQKAMKLASENGNLEMIDTISFSTLIRNVAGDIITVPEGIVFKDPMKMATRVVSALTLADCALMSKALREGKLDNNDDPRYDAITGKQEFTNNLRLQLEERLERENKPQNRLKRLIATGLSRIN